MRILPCILSVLLWLPMPASAETLRLGTFQIPFLVESAQQGVFVKVAQAVAQQAGVHLEIVLLPAQRARSIFEQGQLDGFFPALSTSLTAAHSASIPFSTKRLYAFTLAGKPLPASGEGLSGLQVGFTEGYTYPPELLRVSGALYQPTHSDRQNLAKLLAGRIDIFLGDEMSTLEAIRQQKAQDLVVYNRDQPLVVYPVYFAFADNPRGQGLAERFSAAIHTLTEQGVIQAILTQP